MIYRECFAKLNPWPNLFDSSQEVLSVAATRTPVHQPNGCPQPEEDSELMRLPSVTAHLLQQPDVFPHQKFAMTFDTEKQSKKAIWDIK